MGKPIQNKLMDRHAKPAVANVTSVIGWGFASSGPYVGMAFVELKEWVQRNADAILDGDVEARLPPSVRGVGHADGFTFRLENRGGVGLDALKAARAQLADRAKAYALGVPFERIAGLLGGTFGSNTSTIFRRRAGCAA